jgi:spectinomycin phosphotransferase
MRTRPPDVDDGQLIEAAQRGWGAPIAAVEYVAVGGGSHHWRAMDARGALVWLTLDDLDDKPFLGITRDAVLDGLQKALETAVRLHKSALDFVVAPERTRSGAVLLQLDQRYALAVYPYLEGAAFAWGAPLPPRDRQVLLDLLIRLHRATPTVAATAAEIAPELAARDVLESALRDTARSWSSSGPFGEPAREVVARHAHSISQLLLEFDRIVREVRQRQGSPVISHGEPHPSNVMHTASGLRLLDWDTVGLALPERDLWWLAEPGNTLERYAHATGRRVDAQALHLYRLRWFLDDIISSVRRLRAPHTRTVDAQRSWDFLKHSMEDNAWMH